MNPPIDDNELERTLADAFDAPPEADFDAWQRRHPQATAHLDPERMAAQVRRRRMMTRTIKSAAAIAAGLALVVIVWMAGGGDGAQEAYAAAMDGVRQARTFSCTQAFMSRRDGPERVVSETLFMFKEPDRERRERLAGKFPEYIGEVEIVDYGKRRRMYYRPVTKTAGIVDKSTSYVIDPDTGRLELSQLDTSLRDKLLGWSARAAEDLGNVELDGETVRLLRSRRKQNVFTIWVDPQTDLPVQIELNELDHEQRWLYTSIRIDEELDDDLFSLEPPDGYELFRGGLVKPYSDHVGKMYAKMMYLLKKCYYYHSSEKHGAGRFPSELEDLTDFGVRPEVLRAILAAPDDPDGPPVIRYRQPDPDVDWSAQIMLYEAFDEWPEEGVVVGIADCHAEVIDDPQRFEEMMQ